VAIAATLNIFKTGYELYNAIQVLDRIASEGSQNASEDEIIAHIHMMAYIDGIVDGLALMQDTMIMMLVPTETMNPSEIKEFKDVLNLQRLNIPREGIAVGQAMLIFKKWAKDHPEDLNQSARACLMMSLIDAYGWTKA
jgi:hypothetical protein